MREDIKEDLASIAFSAPFFRDIVKNTLDYIEQLETEYDKLTKHFIDNHIPKTIITTKIEEYEQMRKATYTDMTHFGDLRRDTVNEVLLVLQELMEEK